MEQLTKQVKQMLLDPESLFINRCSEAQADTAIEASMFNGTGADLYSTEIVCSSSRTAGVVSSSETLVTLIIRALSEGLWPGLDLWNVFVTLERCQTLQPKNLAQSYRFASQMVLLIRSSFACASEAVKTRAFVRCALNEGLLLAALEVLSMRFQPILEGYMMDHAIMRQFGGDKWDRLVRAIAPIAGPPLDVVTANNGNNNQQSTTAFHAESSTAFMRRGASEGVNVGAVFDLDLIVPEIDCNRQYMSIVKLYVSGVTEAGLLPVLPIVVVETAPPPPPSPPPAEEVRETTPPATVTADPPTEAAPSSPTSQEPSPGPKKRTTTVKKVVITKRIVKKSNGQVISTSQVEGEPLNNNQDKEPIDDQMTASPRPSSVSNHADPCEMTGDEPPLSLVTAVAPVEPHDDVAPARQDDTRLLDHDTPPAATASKQKTTDGASQSDDNNKEMDEALDILEQLIHQRRLALDEARLCADRAEQQLDRELLELGGGVT